MQSRQPCSAQVPHERATCFRSASRARKILHARIACRDPARVRVVLDGDLIDLYPPERIRVLRLEGISELEDTGASDPRQLFAPSPLDSSSAANWSRRRFATACRRWWSITALRKTR